TCWNDFFRKLARKRPVPGTRGRGPLARRGPMPEHHPDLDELETLVDFRLAMALATAFGPDPDGPTTPPGPADTITWPVRPAPLPPCPAPALAGRHPTFEEIGRGGMGTVLRGHDPDLGRTLAVKVLLDCHRD